ncbi:hypothetical protein PU629_06505 [Pullulanibacillus sp. KACC 23026]|uniref:hypothetical protein n=1 Tax=Pullulanibacillus sp. KACC 23026 TaxID=3028315 RepID=UPI0023AE6DBB|nr:hypothetical protein [Pullulanibacillus sp. KACC 23026]WEG14016.1 hypothetical protein PU629_06505 [Pullulanibacillus sp. KACC 23026]
MVVQGDNGITIPFTTYRDKVVSLESATVEVSVLRGQDLLSKTATIIDKTKGQCEFELLSSDLTVSGVYYYQWTATFDDGTVISGIKQSLLVSDKLAGSTVTIDVDGGVF